MSIITNIIIIENETDWKNEFKNLLDSNFEDIKIDMCISFHEAMTLLTKNDIEYKLAIVDLQLQDPNIFEGFTVAEFFANFKDTSVLIVSGHTNFSEVRRAFKECKVIDFLPKFPFSKINFVNAVNKGLSSEIKNKNRKRIFFSYSHKDEKFKTELDKHLSSLKKGEKIETWHDGIIEPGFKWDNEIKKQIQIADIVLFLVSSDFMASKYIWDIEIPAAMKRGEKGECVVVPIIIRPCDWKELRFAENQGLPKGRAVSKFGKRDDAYLEIVEGIKRIL